MNIKLKMTFIIVITLVLGIVIGAMVNRAISQNRIRDILSRREPARFANHFENIIEPDAAQSKQIRNILSKHAKRISKIREKSREELQSSLKSMMEELDSILTPEQRKRLERRRFPGYPPFPPPFPSLPLGRVGVDRELSRMKERLGLSDDQASQIRQIMEESIDQTKMIREEGVSWRERWKALKELEEKKDKAIEKILTEDQKKLYEQMKKERPKRIEEKMRKRREMMREQGLPRF